MTHAEAGRWYDRLTTVTSSIFALLAAAAARGDAPTSPAVSTIELAPPFASVALPLEPSDPAGPRAAEPGTGEAPENGAQDAAAAIDRYGAVETIEVENVAGTSIPTSLPRAYPRGPQKSLLNRVLDRRERLSARGGGPVQVSKWVFTYDGFLRAPFRAGVGGRRPPAVAGEEPVVGDRAPGQSRYSLHDPIVPDDQYLGYGYTKHSPRDWAELYLTYGNGTVAGTVSIQGFNFSDAAWKEEDIQFGIAQAYVTLTPKFKRDWVKLMWRVGSFYNLYGLSGRYDQGEIETYLFGRTHTMGETLLAEFAVNSDFAVTVEHGVGTTRPDPQFYNAGQFTFMHHAHVGFRYQNKLTFTVHWLNTFTREADRLVAETPNPYPFHDARDGQMHVVGPELRIDWGRLGFIYAGFSYINIETGMGLSRAHEVIHALGGGQFRHGINYIYLAGAESGEVFSVIGQLENSIQKIRLGSAWYGQGPDLVGKFYFMINKVRTDIADEDIERPTSENPYIPLGGADGDLKYKIGFDLLGRPLAWFGIGARVTHVSPDSDFEEQRFTVFSPRLQFRTNFLSHEIIELQYSRYFYAERTCPGMEGTPTAEIGEPIPAMPAACVQPPRNPVAPTGFGSGPNTQPDNIRGPVVLPGPHPFAPDVNVIMLLLTMWW